jgi:hypothetical protein
MEELAAPHAIYELDTSDLDETVSLLRIQSGGLGVDYDLSHFGCALAFAARISAGSAF